MSILNIINELEAKTKKLDVNYDQKQEPDKIFKTQVVDEAYSISMTDEEKTVRAMIIRQFALSDIIMQKPRVEFNDMSVIGRTNYDQLVWNNYQPNNGDGFEGDELNSWKSNAVRPIIRNKCVSIAAHATAHLIFPKIFAYSKTSEEYKDAAIIMTDLMEWASDRSDYAQHSLQRTIAALVMPASIGYQEYAEVYRKVKIPKETGGYDKKLILDEDLSGFQNVVVPASELYIENFYEPDIQKQGYLIWRRVLSYSTLEAKYAAIYPKFKYVLPGVQLIYNDANNTFYYVYDPNMRQDMGEEVIYWNKNSDLKIIMVNGIMLTDADNPNPRNNKLYPFDKFGYQLISDKCFYYKSLAFLLMQDAKIVNDLYNMIIDGTYLNIMPPMINVGGEAITSDVIIPGAVTTFSSPDADLKVIQTTDGQRLKTSMDTLFKVNESINESSLDPNMEGQQNKGNQTAYEISRQEQNASTILGLFVKMISQHVKDFGRLRLGDIIQYLTIADVDKVEENTELIYKSFVVSNRNSEGKTRSRQIKFKNFNAEMTPDQELKASYDVLEAQGGIDSKTELYLANPKLIRDLCYHLTVSPDVLSPKSEDLERAYNLEAYDRMIANPLTNQEEAYRLLLGSYDTTKRDPDKFIAKPEMNSMINQSAPALTQSNNLTKPANSLPQSVGNTKV